MTQLVDELSGDLASVQSVQDVAQAKKFNPKISASLGAFSGADIFDALQHIRDGAKTDATRSPKLAEFDTFACGRSEIGVNHPTAKLFAQTLTRDAWADPAAGIDLSGITRGCLGGCRESDPNGEMVLRGNLKQRPKAPILSACRRLGSLGRC
jgi:hypothetical protein